MRVGIDASNLRQGGGITHLVQMLAAADPPASGVDRVVVWGVDDVLASLPNRAWLARERPDGLHSTARRMWWQQHRLAAAARGVDLLFLPGGTYLGRFRPFVTMFRNMLPFDGGERRRYGLSRMRVKLELLRAAQRSTFARADGLIFLTEYARRVLAATGVGVCGRTAVIPHGVDPQFFLPPREQRPLEAYAPGRPYRWLYVSSIQDYKRPCRVAEAAALLRQAGAPIALEFVGPPYAPSLRRLTTTLDRVDPARAFITMTPGIPHGELVERYRQADAFVFASSCENMPNSLLEAMAAGLPIASSDRGSMTGILRDAAMYFDPDAPASMPAAMDRLMRDAGLRTRLSAAAHALARPYDWARCAQDTFDFLVRVGTA
jgi:glycosyltransferase involved in cell wall biosynthesis